MRNMLRAVVIATLAIALVATGLTQMVPMSDGVKDDGSTDRGTDADGGDGLALPAEDGTDGETTLNPGWNQETRGGCCEANVAAGNDTVYWNSVQCTPCNNLIYRSSDGGATWEKIYPPHVPRFGGELGIEGDVRAFGDDIVYFGTLVSHGVAAHSDDRGDNWTVTPVAVPWAVNDQAWLYMGPVEACPQQTEDYVLTGWFRVGTVAAFSCDGGLTWPIQMPLPGTFGSSLNPLCRATAEAPAPPSDTRVADADFSYMKSGRHGGWGTDGAFYWSILSGDDLYVCRTDDFGATWTGHVHDVGPGPSTPVTTMAFDQHGTMYVLARDTLHVSFNQGATFAYNHTLPTWGDAGGVADDAAQWFVVDDGTIHLGVLADSGSSDEVVYVQGAGVDTASPTWSEETVTTHDGSRLDFMQIAATQDGVPTIGYTINGDSATSTRDAAP